MKKLLVLAAFLPGFAWAGDEALDCAKHDGVLQCKVKADRVSVRSVTINGGDCPAPAKHEIFNKTFYKGEKFSIPGTKECHYVSGVSIMLGNGKTQHLHAL